jgi:PTS system ascorbate-specific IIC component
VDINTIATFLLNNLFNQVALLVGIFVAIGLLAQGKGARLTIEGTIRAALGYVILGVGIDVFIGGLIAFQNVVGAAFGITPPTSTNTLSGFLQTSGSAVALIMAGGYLVHLILGRILRTKFVYLTGHLMYWISVVIAVSVYQSVPGASAAQVALFGSLVAGVYWTIQPALLQRFMKKITGNNDVGFAHTSSLAVDFGQVRR